MHVTNRICYKDLVQYIVDASDHIGQPYENMTKDLMEILAHNKTHFLIPSNDKFNEENKAHYHDYIEYHLEFLQNNDDNDE